MRCNASKNSCRLSRLTNSTYMFKKEEMKEDVTFIESVSTKSTTIQPSPPLPLMSSLDQCMLVLAFESVDKILKPGHTNESY